MQRKRHLVLTRLPGLVAYLEGSSPNIDLHSIMCIVTRKKLNGPALTSSIYQALTTALSHSPTEEAQHAVIDRAIGIFPHIKTLFDNVMRQTPGSSSQKVEPMQNTILGQTLNMLDLYRVFTDSSHLTGEEELQRLISVALEGIYQLNAEDRIICVNPLLASMLGYTSGEMIGQSVYDFFLDCDVQQIRQQIMANRNGETRLEYVRLRHCNGQLIWALIWGMPLFDAQGGYNGALGIVPNVAGRNWREEVEATVYRIMQAAEVADTLQLYYELVYCAIRNLLPLSQLEIVLREPSSTEVHVVYASGGNDTSLAAKQPVCDLIDYVLRTGLILMTSPQEVGRLQHCGDLDSAQTYPLHWLGVPLKTHGHVVGILSLQLLTDLVPFGSWDVGDLELVAVHISTNIERIQANERLRESEAVYKAMFEVNEAVKMLIDPRNGEIVEANPAACEFYGYSASVLRGMRITDINTLPPEQVQADMTWALNARQTYFLFKHRLASGEIRDVEVYSSPLNIHNRNLLFSIVHDITSRRKAENDLQFRLKLEKTQARLSTDFLAASPVDLNLEIVRALQVMGTFLGADIGCVLQAKPDGNTFSCSHFWSADNLYVSMDSLQESWLDQMVDWLHGYGQGDVVRIQRTEEMPPEAEPGKGHMLARGIRSFICAPFFQVSTQDGWVAFLSKSPMREWTEGDLDALRMLAQVFANVLQRRRIELAVRQHEQELQTLIDNSPDIICRFNGEMRCLYFSAPEQGYIKAVAADVVGKSLFEMNLPDNEKALFEEAIRRVFLTGRPVTVVAAISIPQEQQPRYYQVRIAPMLDIKGNLESVMCVARDVTELERAKHEIEALNRSLELRVIERTQQLEEANRHLELEIEQHQRHKVELIASRVHIRDIAQRVVTAQEGERQRISRVLHDEVTQDLMALTMTLAWLQKKLPHDSTEQMHRLDACMLSIEMTTEQIRQLAHDLRPPSLDALGLDRALESYCKVLAERMSMYITYDGIVLPELPDRVSICLYRAAQEGLTNVVKHAQAKHIWVSLLYGSRGIMLTIRDDGQGFDVGAMRQRMATQAIPWGVGLRGMRERFELLGGRFSIHSSLHAGTRLTGFIPMHMIKEQTE
jgi:PAS domain S-box-containing protein